MLYRKKICNVKFDEKILETHRIEEPYTCKYCQKHFSDHSILEIHEKVHNGEKTFQCETCKKCYGDPSNLRKHKMIQTGDKPFNANM